MKWNYIIKKLIIILIAITLIVPISCQKTYEDGLWVSLRSPLRRLQGDWKIESYIINGIEKIQEYNDSCGCEWSFAYHGVDQHELMAINCNESFHYQEFIHSSSYRLEENDEVLKILPFGTWSDSVVFYDTPIVTIIYKNEIYNENKNVKWIIKKLTNKKMKLETNYKDKNYVVILH